MRMPAHIGSENPGWSKYLRLAEECPVNILPEHLRIMPMDTGVYTGLDLARELYVFLGKFLDHSTYDRMQALAGGCVGNGFQLWRSVFQE